MIRVNHKLNSAAESHLQRVIEPLASYISAANRPRTALKAALAALLSEIDETNRVAKAHVTTLMENHWS
jgi:hypothetical protein